MIGIRVVTRKLGRNHFLAEQRGQKEIRPPDFSRSRCEIRLERYDFRPYRQDDPPIKPKFENRLLAGTILQPKQGMHASIAARWVLP